MSVSATVRVRKCRFERNTECKSKTLGFVGLYWVDLSVCIIPPIIYNLLPPWTYPVLGNHVNLLVLCFLCVCFRSSMHNKLCKSCCTDSMVSRKRHMLNFFQQWLSDFSDGGKLQTSLFPILSTDAFRKMTDVKFLQLNYTNFHGSFEHFPKNLIWLCWHGLSSRSIPNHVCLEKLVVLDLSRSCLVDAWKGKLVCIN